MVTLSNLLVLHTAQKQKLSRKEQDQVGKCEELLSTMRNPSVEQKGMFGLSKEGEGQESTSNLHTVNN